MNSLETQVLELIGENTADPDVFVDTDAGLEPIRDSLNDAIEEISLVTSSMKRKYLIMLEENKNVYRLLFNRNQFGWITGVWDRINQRRIEQTDFIRLRNFNSRWLQNTGPPRSYVPVGLNAVMFWPKPAGSGIYELDIAMIPERYQTSTDRITLRRTFEQAAVHFAVSEFWAGRGDARTAMVHFGEYLKRLGLDGVFNPAAEREGGFTTRKEPWPKSTD
jgi:hypothetical protein